MIRHLYMVCTILYHLVVHDLSRAETLDMLNGEHALPMLPGVVTNHTMVPLMKDRPAIVIRGRQPY